MTDYAIKVNNLNLESESGKLLLQDIQLAFEARKLHMILGPNGAGKTLLLKCLSGLLDTYKGEISYFGSTSHSLSIEKKSKLIGGYQVRPSKALTLKS